MGDMADWQIEAMDIPEDYYEMRDREQFEQFHQRLFKCKNCGDMVPRSKLHYGKCESCLY